MKKNYLKIISGTLLFSAAMLLTSCGNDEAPDTLTIDKSRADFSSQATEAIQVNVESYRPWSVKSTESWVRAEYNADGFMVKADKNRTVRQRGATLTVYTDRASQTIEVLQDRGTAMIKALDPSVVGAMPITAISGNGRYVVGSHSGSGFIMDIDSQIGEDMLSEAILFRDDVGGVSNEGVRVKSGITPDGRIEVGYQDVMWNNDNFYQPYYIKNGQKVILPYPEEDILGFTPYQASIPLKISDDGNYILCRHTTAPGSWTEAWWKLEGDRYVYHSLNADDIQINTQDNSLVSFPTPEYLSRGGKYTAGRYISDKRRPFFRDLSTGVMTVLTNVNDSEEATAVTDDGYVFVSKLLTPDGKRRETLVYSIQDNDYVSFADWISTHYDLTGEELEAARYATVIDLTADRGRIVWWDHDGGYLNYILTVE